VHQNRCVGIRETTYRRRYDLDRMNTSARQMSAESASSLVGRDEAVARVLAGVQPPYVDALAVLIEGPAGIGKTSLLRAGVAKAETAGATVLYARPVETEANYSYATLGDLLGPRLASIDVRLAEVHRAVLRRALGNDDVPESADAAAEEPPDAQRVAIAVLAAFRALAAGGALLIAIDDAPWADPASRDALAFSVRRLDGLPVRLLIAKRSDMPGGPPPFGLAGAARPIPIERLWLEPLSMGALHQLLRSATDSSFARPTLLRIQELSGGNPFYALELARALVASGTAVRPGQGLPMPSSLRGLVGAHLDRVPASTRRLLLTVALSAKPTMALLEAVGGPGTRTALEPAGDAGLICVDGPTVTFDHPLYASTLVAEASADEVRAVHAVLARTAAEDPEARARHLALASEGPDAGVASSLARAATRAMGRGAPAMAGELADMAVERTPPASRERSERALAAAEAWFAAGDLPATRERAAALIPFLRGPLRARALLLMGLCAWYTRPAQEAVAELLPALSSARNDRRLLGLLHFYLAVFRDFDIAEARSHSASAARLLEGTSDRGHLAAALLQTFHWTVALGRRPPMALLAKGLAVETEGPLTDRLTSPGIWWAGIGRLDLARERFQHMLDFDLIDGQYSNVANLRTRLAEVELWSDDWPAARRHAVGAVEASLETGGGASEMALRALALVDACEGSLERAQAAAADGTERTERSGSDVVAAAWLQVTALVAASRGEAAAVEEATGRAWHHLRQAGYMEPMRLDPSPERIEALAILGRPDEARVELAGLEARNRRVAKPWAAAAIVRGRARIAIAEGDVEAAIAATSMVAAGPPPGWSRFDVGRVLLMRGEALRHSRSRRDSADALRRAQEIFVDLGATVWAQRAKAEEARLGMTRSSALALTPTEARVARLAGDGLSTRGVAAELGISPRTVETHLASLYGKLGVTSRAELGRVMVQRETNEPPPGFHG
jgi:DNA-binding CsgD family transcriptional regulator